MGYVLHFCHPAEATFDRRLLRHYFQTSDRFTLSEVPAGLEVAYENPDTGVYCSFELCESPADTDLEWRPVPEEFTDAGLRFYLNYLRPGFFADETMPIVADLCEVFGLLVQDDQESGMPEPADAQDLIRRYRTVNARAIRAAANDDSEPVIKPYLSPPEAHAWWLYNKERERLQRALGEDAFVPLLFVTYDEESDRVCRVVLWPDGIPQVFPECDYVRVMRHLDDEDPQAEEEGYVPYEDALRVLRPMLRALPDEAVPGLRLLPPEEADRAADVFARLTLEDRPDLYYLDADDFVDVEVEP